MMIHKRSPQKLTPFRGLQNHERPATSQIPFKNVCIYTLVAVVPLLSFFPENSGAMRETLGRPEAGFFCGSLRPKLKSESDQKLFFPSCLLSTILYYILQLVCVL